ncbi:hypothetical protein KP509_37G042100 [Ceratopteris richardii]|uniref:Uncharacterized protein n=1 Tax=Ceratopteris richardii TaxID=49495 RepID=A0A8T2Q7D0_CERRI|nr:hypothetical protein KP509_37G042100 [Ceratopteris richardii]
MLFFLFCSVALKTFLEKKKEVLYRADITASTWLERLRAFSL